MGLEQISSASGVGAGTETVPKEIELIGSKSAADAARDLQKQTPAPPPPAKVRAPEEKKPVNLGRLKEGTETLNRILENFNIRLSFELFEDIDRVMVRVINRESNKVIKEIPPKEMMTVLQKINEYIGVMLDDLV